MQETTINTGTELKVSLTMEQIGTARLSSVGWSAYVWSSDVPYKGQTIAKEQAIKVDDDTYILLLDSDKIGPGRYKLTLTANLPDADYPDGLRTEVQTIDLGIVITPTVCRALL